MPLSDHVFDRSILFLTILIDGHLLNIPAKLHSILTIALMGECVNARMCPCFTNQIRFRYFIESHLMTISIILNSGQRRIFKPLHSVQ